MPLRWALRDSTFGRTALGAWQWWVDELSQMLPDHFSLAGRKPRVGLLLHPSGIVIERVHGAIGEKLEEARPIEQLDPSGWDELAALVEGASARIILAPPDIFMTQIELPVQARSRLRSAVALQLPLIVPVDPSLLIWKAEVLASSKAHLTVGIAMAKQSRLSEISRLFAEQGVPPPAIAAIVEGHTIELVPAKAGAVTEAQRSNRKTKIAVALLIASIPVSTLLASWLLTDLAQARTAILREELEPRLEEERQAARSEQLRRTLKIILENPPATETLEALALGLPEPAFAREAQRDPGGSLLFTVETAEPEKVDSALAKVPALQKVYATDLTALDGGKMLAKYRMDAR